MFLGSPFGRCQHAFGCLIFPQGLGDLILGMGMQEKAQPRSINPCHPQCQDKTSLEWQAMGKDEAWRHPGEPLPPIGLEGSRRVFG